MAAPAREQDSQTKQELGEEHAKPAAGCDPCLAPQDKAGRASSEPALPASVEGGDNRRGVWGASLKIKRARQQGEGCAAAGAAAAGSRPVKLVTSCPGKADGLGCQSWEGTQVKQLSRAAVT